VTGAIRAWFSKDYILRILPVNDTRKSAPCRFCSPRPTGAPPAKELEIRPKQVKAWIDSLPLAQSMDSARKMSGHLASLNRARIDNDTRLAILEAYRAPAATALEELDAVYSKAAMPLPPRAREALMVARDLASELAMGYQITLVERSGKLLGAFSSKKGLPGQILGTLEYKFAILRASYKSYTPPPPGLWTSMHQLYLHAEQEGVAKEVVDAETKSTVFDVYCEALLLSLTDPYRLVAGELDKVIAQMRGWRGLVTLQQARPATRPGGHFLVPCDTDRPPKPMIAPNEDAGGPNWRLLDANPMVDRVRAKKNAAETGNVSATMSKSLGPEGLALLGRLATLWGDPPKRSSRRNPSESTVAICVGIKAVSHFVAFEPRMDAAQEAEALKRGITMPLVALPVDDAQQAIPVIEWDVVNESTGGLKVRRLDASQPIGVGEVIGVKLKNRARWTIAVARWITMFEEGGMEFGIQFLGSMATPVWVQPTITSAPQAKQGLLFAFADSGEADAVLTAPNTFADLREFELNEDGMVTVVRATSLIEKTGRFELFHVTPS
jgi:hypothetical protein